MYMYVCMYVCMCVCVWQNFRPDHCDQTLNA